MNASDLEELPEPRVLAPTDTASRWPRVHLYAPRNEPNVQKRVKVHVVRPAFHPFTFALDLPYVESHDFVVESRLPSQGRAVAACHDCRVLIFNGDGRILCPRCTNALRWFPVPAYLERVEAHWMRYYRSTDGYVFIVQMLILVAALAWFVGWFWLPNYVGLTSGVFLALCVLELVVTMVGYQLDCYASRLRLFKAFVLELSSEPASRT